MYRVTVFLSGRRLRLLKELEAKPSHAWFSRALLTYTLTNRSRALTFKLITAATALPGTELNQVLCASMG